MQTPFGHGRLQGLSHQCSSYVPSFQHSADPSAYCGLSVMLFSSLFYYVKLKFYQKLPLYKGIVLGSILVLSSTFHMPYHVMRCSISGFTFLVGTLRLVQRMLLRCTAPNVSIHYEECRFLVCGAV
jgi:hypothetical protein